MHFNQFFHIHWFSIRKATNREDKYKPNTERKNVAEIIIAKHRNGPVGKVELYFDETRVTFRDMEKDAYQQEPEEEESVL